MNGSKLPGPDTGIEIKHTMCDICTPGPQCGVDAYVKDGVVVKLEGTAGFPGSGGRLCTRGAAGRQYLYRKDRLRTPLRRTGPRGSGRFEPVSWDEALDLCARELSRLRGEDPDSVVWMAGYPKWFRPMLHRLAHSFGTENYLTESSACHQAGVMAQKAVFGRELFAPFAGAHTVVLWGTNPVVSGYPRGRAIMKKHESGDTVVVIDPRVTETAQTAADLHIRPRAGTDAALAHAVARCILHNGWQDAAFIERYVHGFEAYRDYVERFDPETAEAVTGVPAGTVCRLAELLAKDPTAVILPGNALAHRVNGFNTHRAVLCLPVLLGRVDRPGGLRPVSESLCHSDGGFVSREREFIDATRPARCKSAVGKTRFPLWGEFVDEGQGMDLVRQIETGDPYPIRGMAAFGVSDRMYPASPRFLAAMDRLEFVLAADIFETDVCRHADIVLPVCTSYERSEAKCYGGRFVNLTEPAVPPLYDSRPDTEVLRELSARLGLGDELLEAGYEACIEYILAPSGITDWEAVRRAPLPTPAPNAAAYEYGSYLRSIPTPSGRIELYSQVVARYADRGLDPLPAYVPAERDPDYPFTLIAGTRLSHTIHSRCHEVPWLRAMGPEPTAELNPADGASLGLREGEDILLAGPGGRIRVKAHLTEKAAPGEVLMVHGYREANVNALLSPDHLDPYSGFPGYKQAPCAVLLGEEAAV